MKIRFYNAKILTLIHDKYEIIEGELWIRGNSISYIGKPKRNKELWNREIDVEGNLLMPGFKNAHTHSAMTFLRSYADDLPLFEWLNKKIFPKEAQLQENDIFWLSKLAIMEYLTSGITSNFDMYFHPEEIVKASIACGFRTVVVSTLNNSYSSLKEMEEEYMKYNNYHPLISYCLGFHAEYSNSKELLEGVAKLSQKYHAPVFMHNSETKQEVAECIKRYRKTPTAFLNSLGMFEYGGGGFHCLYMSDEDLAIYRKKNLTVVTNPGSNTKLASGIAPIEKMLNQGICVAIGTDGPASNNCLDMFREMFLVTGLAKLRESNAASVPAEEVLKMATSNGAIAMGLVDCDRLQVGKKADLIMIDLHQPNMQPMNNIVKNIVYSGSKLNVKMTMVDGKILYENGNFFTNEEPEIIYQKANEIIQRMK